MLLRALPRLLAAPRPSWALPARRHASDAAAASPVQGMVVVELANVLAGPSVGQFMAELGARVIKVESTRGGGDMTRTWRAPTETAAAGSGDVPAYFSSCNWGKESLAVDLTREEGRRVVYSLVRRADVVITSYKPGDAAKLGADAATLLRENPRVVVAELTGFGSDDPRPAFDAVLQAETGFMYMNGHPDGPPTKMPVALIDVLAAHQLKEGVLLRLLHRERTGLGGHVSVSLAKAGVSALVNQATNWLHAGHLPQRMGSSHPNIVPYGDVFTTRDGVSVVIAAGTDEQFRQLCAVLGVPELGTDPRFATNPDRRANRAELMATLQRKVADQQHGADFVAALDARAVPVGRVNDMKAVFEQPFAQPMKLQSSASSAKGLRQVAFASAAGTPAVGEAPLQAVGGELAPPPSRGAHTDSVLRWLGLGDDAIAQLRGLGVVK